MSVYQEYNLIRFSAALLAAIKDDAQRESMAARLSALSTGRNGTLKGWAKIHHGATVDTLQATYSLETDKMVRAWQAGSRELAYKATYMKMDGSRADYAGVTVVGKSENALLTVANGLKDSEVIYTLYTVEPHPR